MFEWHSGKTIILLVTGTHNILHNIFVSIFKKWNEKICIEYYQVCHGFQFIDAKVIAECHSFEYKKIY